MAVSLHWLGAILVLVLIPTTRVPRGGHGRSCGQGDVSPGFICPRGIAVLVLTALRIVWWWRLPVPDPSPIPLTYQWPGEQYVAIVVLLGMIASGTAR